MSFTVGRNRSLPGWYLDRSKEVYPANVRKRQSETACCAACLAWRAKSTAAHGRFDPFAELSTNECYCVPGRPECRLQLMAVRPTRWSVSALMDACSGRRPPFRARNGMAAFARTSVTRHQPLLSAALVHVPLTAPTRRSPAPPDPPPASPPAPSPCPSRPRASTSCAGRASRRQAGLAVDLLRHQHLAVERPGQVLQARGDVDGVADHGELGVPRIADLARRSRFRR